MPSFFYWRVFVLVFSAARSSSLGAKFSVAVLSFNVSSFTLVFDRMGELDFVPSCAWDTRYAAVA